MTERPPDLRELLGDRSRGDPLTATLTDLAMRCLEKEPEARVASADALLARLSEAGVRGPARTSRIVVAVAAAALVTAGIAG